MKKKTKELVSELKNRFCKSMSKSRWSSFMWMTLCLINLSFTFKELLRSWKLRPRLLIVFRGKLLSWQRRTLSRKMSLKLLIKKKKFNNYSKNENKILKVKLPLLVYWAMRSLRRKKLSLLTCALSLKKINLILQMMTKKNKRISSLKD